MTATFFVTKRAYEQIARIATRKSIPPILRISVEGGGCSGFQYQFSFDKTKAKDDLLLESEGVSVLIDPDSLAFIKGSELDYVTKIAHAAFVIQNPNATAQCGCGNSFGI